MNFKCDNCDFTADESKFNEARHLSQRLDVGGIYTDKECPECGMLAYPVEPGSELSVGITVGDWSAVECLDDDGNFQGMLIGNVAEGKRVCLVEGILNEETNEIEVDAEAKANIALLSAAPDLLKSLEEIRSYTEHGDAQEDTQNVRVLLPYDVLGRMIAAVNKATTVAP